MRTNPSGRHFSYFIVLITAWLLAGCTNLVAPYDATFDQSLNQLSSDTAKFLAAAAVKNAPERSVTSKEAVAYYAVTYNLLDRLSQRAELSRAAVPCATNSVLKLYWAQSINISKPLPEDYESLDCREFNLYAVRHFVDQLRFAHGQKDGLNPGRIKINGGALQVAILGAIQTFIVTKPPSAK